jgi:hypothetical protein
VTLRGGHIHALLSQNVEEILIYIVKQATPAIIIGVYETFYVSGR